MHVSGRSAARPRFPFQCWISFGPRSPMNKSQLNPAPDLTIPAIPVICDECRETGMAGDGRFAGVPDILDFEPVPRRARSDGWKPEHQRAFIPDLAITGS